MKLLPLALGAVLLTGCSAGASPAVDAAPDVTAAGFHGAAPVTDIPRPSFVLTDTEGKPYDFMAETRGRPTFVYFGYANCPDECPTAMADLAAALRTTPSALRGQARVVFITSDPARDTGPVIRRFLDQFSTEFVGLTGSQQQVDAAQRALGLAVAKRGGPVETLPGKPDEHVHAPGTAPHEHFGPLGYGVAHADLIFAFDARDRMPVLYNASVRPSDIAADLPLLASGDDT